MSTSDELRKYQLECLRQAADCKYCPKRPRLKLYGRISYKCLRCGMNELREDRNRNPLWVFFIEQPYSS